MLSLSRLVLLCFLSLTAAAVPSSSGDRAETLRGRRRVDLDGVAQLDKRATRREPGGGSVELISCGGANHDNYCVGGPDEYDQYQYGRAVYYDGSNEYYDSTSDHDDYNDDFRAAHDHSDNHHDDPHDDFPTARNQCDNNYNDYFEAVQWRSNNYLGHRSTDYVLRPADIYWLCQDENVSPFGYYTDKGRVREALAIAVAMGANTVRLHTCGVSIGANNPYNLEPSNNVWPDVAWDIHDYVIYAAGQYGLRVIMPLSDNYDFYHGGKYDILRFTGVSQANKGAQFFTNQYALNAFTASYIPAAMQVYVKKLLSHTNVYNGKRWADDPTILEAWPPAAWTTAVINAIKSIDKNHLVIDDTTGATPAGLQVPTVDIVTDHGYPRKTDILSKEIQIARAAKKGFFIGEFDWTSTGGGVSLSSYLSAIEGAGNYLGSYVLLYYPNGNSNADQQNILLLVQHWYRITGRKVPTSLPGVACPQPYF
ncbi:hypothetical protein Rhopal_007620-T1 [Rhodotorula paludigena]|uniref:mannan endo-1,4-beta-mannosidase n=1 Tax=Rhodotorula paludigena TaxID=86838 RepID=A0AAV5GZX4_9BASI|nr:hypothetical protein Rhopal_007620-T1 [Rhodotorula paludigena]